MEFFGQVNFLKGALTYSDFVTTVSRKYSQEIQTAEYGFGLEGVLRDRAATVTGILNGVDYDEWSPQADKFIVPLNIRRRICRARPSASRICWRRSG
jgi:starch synthase